MVLNTSMWWLYCCNGIMLSYMQYLPLCYLAMLLGVCDWLGRASMHTLSSKVFQKINSSQLAEIKCTRHTPLKYLQNSVI